MESTICMLHIYNLSNSIWANAIATMCYIQNKSFSTALGSSMMPITLWNGTTLYLSHVCIFGCLEYAQIIQTNQKL
jgi:uncharacterized protein with PQ loop repeat